MLPSSKLWNKGALLRKDGLWDRIAVIISGLCLIHCISTIVLVALLSSAAGVLLDPIIHEVGIAIAIALGLFTLGRGISDHGFYMPAIVGGIGLSIMAAAVFIGHEGSHGGMEILLTMVGVGILALGHNLNYRART